MNADEGIYEIYKGGMNALKGHKLNNPGWRTKGRHLGLNLLPHLSLKGCTFQNIHHISNKTKSTKYPHKQ